MQIILGSKSPRRRLLLQAAGLAIEVRPAHIDESLLPDEDVASAVQRLAFTKAAAIGACEYPVIAADTLVALGGRLLGQPTDLDEARDMLKSLSGSTHQVFTGVCVTHAGYSVQRTMCSEVSFYELSDVQIDTYLQHNEVLDKAGAYEIQGGAASFVHSVSGPLDNVIGLPVRLTMKMLDEVITHER
ncbi:MAG: Maf family protein [Mariprofundaceae bacterium]|nr:Maf family protein [Mariprofundaceae bacterium]